MYKRTLFLVIVLSFSDIVYGGGSSFSDNSNQLLPRACSPYDGRTGLGYMEACKRYFWGIHYSCDTYMSSKQSCTNFNSDKEYEYGQSKTAEYQCIVYSRPGCKGENYVVAEKRIKLPWRAFSMKCPYLC